MQAKDLSLGEVKALVDFPYNPSGAVPTGYTTVQLTGTLADMANGLNVQVLQ